jgi:hypothetical protein
MGNEEQTRQTERAYDYFAGIRNVLPYSNHSRLQVAATTPDDWYSEYDAMKVPALSLVITALSAGTPFTLTPNGLNTTTNRRSRFMTERLLLD